MGGRKTKSSTYLAKKLQAQGPSQIPSFQRKPLTTIPDDTVMGNTTLGGFTRLDSPKGSEIELELQQVGKKEDEIDAGATGKEDRGLGMGGVDLNNTSKLDLGDSDDKTETGSDGGRGGVLAGRDTKDETVVTVSEANNVREWDLELGRRP